jgi:hypothetical protein
MRKAPVTLQHFKIDTVLRAMKVPTLEAPVGYFPGTDKCVARVTNDRGPVLLYACQYLHFYVRANCTVHTGVSRQRRYG